MGRGRIGVAEATLALLLLALANGCGKSESEADKAKRYRAQATAVCQQFDREQMQFVLPITNAQVPAHVDRVLAVSTAAADGLRGLKAPKKLAALHRSVVAAMDSEIGVVRRARRGERPLTIARVNALARETTAAHGRARADFAALELAACAEAGTRPSPAQRYRAKLGSICAGSAKRVERLTDAKPQSLDETVRLLRQLRAAVSALDRQVRGTPPPPELARAHRDLSAQLRQVLRSVDALVRQVDAGDLAAAEVGVAPFQRLANRFDATAHRYHIAC